jgi:hypothetical protein
MFHCSSLEMIGYGFVGHSFFFCASFGRKYT